jgi:hypothetical protein
MGWPVYIVLWKFVIPEVLYNTFDVSCTIIISVIIIFNDAVGYSDCVALKDAMTE